MFKELLGEAFPIIESIAPIAAKALGCPFLGTASIALSVLAKIINNGDMKIENVSSSILNNPETPILLKSLDDQFKTHIAESFLDLLHNIQPKQK